MQKPGRETSMPDNFGRPFRGPRQGVLAKRTQILDNDRSF